MRAGLPPLSSCTGPTVLRQAVTVAPDSAIAHSELARALIHSGWYTSIDTKIVVPAASAAATRALAIDPSLSDPHLVLANIAAFYDWNWDEAEARYEMALERNPNHAPAHLDYAAQKIVTGDIARARELMTSAIDIDPNSAATYGQVGTLLHFVKDWDLAQRQFDMALELEPENNLWKIHKACSYMFEGRLDLAEFWIRQAIEEEPENPFPRVIEAYYNALVSETGKAEACA